MRYRTFAEGFFRNIAVRGGREWMVSCPYHGGSDSLQFNIETGRWYCFGCKKGGRNVQSLANDDSLPDYEPSPSHLKAKLARLRGDTSATVMPMTWLAQFDVPHDYWDTRATKLSQSYFRLGYDIMLDKVTIPLTVRGGVLGVIRRAVDNITVPRYAYPKGFQRSMFLFNSHRIPLGVSTLFVVEGSLDVVHAWEAGHNAVAVLGSSISTYQAETIRKLGPEKLVLAFDNDDAGRDAVVRAREHLRGLPTKVLSWDVGFKDLGDYDLPARKSLLGNYN